MSSGSSGRVLKNLFTGNSLEAKKPLLEDSTSKLYNAERDGDALRSSIIFNEDIKALIGAQTLDEEEKALTKALTEKALDEEGKAQFKDLLQAQSQTQLQARRQRQQAAKAALQILTSALS